MHDAGGEQLPHALERFDRLLHGLRRETVHQVGMNQDTGFTESVGDASHLLDRDALVHELEQPVGGDFETARDGDSARRF